MSRVEQIEELNRDSGKYVGMRVREIADILQNPTGTGVISNSGNIYYYSLREREYKHANQISADTVAKGVHFSAGYGYGQINATINF